MDVKIALLVGLVVGLIAVAIWLWPSPVPILIPAAEITVEDATGQWTVGLRRSTGLISDAATVLPRIRTDHAATASLVSLLLPSTELTDATAGNVAAHIVVEHAATASTLPLGVTTAPSEATSPRVLVEYASTATLIGPITTSSGLQSDSAKVSTKLLIENAEVVDTLLLEAMPLGSPGE